MSQEPVKIVVVVSGGMVQSIATFGVPVAATVVDYDCEDADEDCATEVPDLRDGDCQALIEGNAVFSEWRATPLNPKEVHFLDEANS